MVVIVVMIMVFMVMIMIVIVVVMVVIVIMIVVVIMVMMMVMMLVVVFVVIPVPVAPAGRIIAVIVAVPLVVTVVRRSRTRREGDSAQTNYRGGSAGDHCLTKHRKPSKLRVGGNLLLLGDVPIGNSAERYVAPRLASEGWKCEDRDRAGSVTTKPTPDGALI
jgi:membrane protein implicated in regulation of membrane protease activity